MRSVSIIVMAMAMAACLALGASKEGKMRQEKDRILTREANERSAAPGTDLVAAESDAMREFSDLRPLANVGCQYCTETIIILDNSSAIFDKELWMFKLLIKEIAAAFLGANSGSRLGLILTTAPSIPLIFPGGVNSQTIQAIWQTVKGIQRVSGNSVGDVHTATTTAIGLFNLTESVLPKTHNLLLLVAPYPLLIPQLAASIEPLDSHPQIRRFAVGTRMTQPVYQAALEGYVGCPGTGHVQYVGNCTPARFLFLLKRLYPMMCVPVSYYREAAIMTFQVDGMAVDDENLPEFVDQFLDLMSQSTGVDREYLEVIDVRDSSSTTGPQYNARRLKSIESLVDYPQDTLLDIVVRDSPAGSRDTPFRIAGKLDSDLRNDLSPVASLFNQGLTGIPKVRSISQPRESILTRQSNGLTFHKLYLGNGGLGAALGQRAPLSEILQH